jgi:hypothetical protein
VGLLGNHHAATEETTIEGHGGVSVGFGPLTSDVRISILGTTKSTTGNENDVLLTTKTTIHLKQGLVEVFKRVVTAAATTSPLENHRKSRVGLGDVDHSLDGIKRTRLERNVLQTQSLDVLLRDLDGRNTSANGKTLNGDTLGSEASEEGNLPRHGMRVDVD